MTSNVIRNAVSTGTMWRGLEVILKGRDPRDAWAFVERICGVCTGTHALTSVRAVEDALAIKIPDNANIIRNLMQLNLYIHDHLVHFYHLHALDWVERGFGAEGRSQGDLDAGPEHFQLAAVVAGLLPRHPESPEEVRRIGSARPVYERLLGQPGLQAATRSQPDGGGTLSGSARFPEGSGQGAHHLRWQEPAPELAGRWRALRHQPGRRRCRLAP